MSDQNSSRRGHRSNNSTPALNQAAQDRRQSRRHNPSRVIPPPPPIPQQPGALVQQQYQNPLYQNTSSSYQSEFGFQQDPSSQHSSYGGPATAVNVPHFANQSPVHYVHSNEGQVIVVPQSGPPHSNDASSGTEWSSSSSSSAAPFPSPPVLNLSLSNLKPVGWETDTPVEFTALGKSWPAEQLISLIWHYSGCYAQTSTMAIPQSSIPLLWYHMYRVRAELPRFRVLNADPGGRLRWETWKQRNIADRDAYDKTSACQNSWECSLQVINGALERATRATAGYPEWENGWLLRWSSVNDTQGAAMELSNQEAERLAMMPKFVEAFFGGDRRDLDGDLEKLDDWIRRFDRYGFPRIFRKLNLDYETPVLARSHFNDEGRRALASAVDTRSGSGSGHGRRSRDNSASRGSSGESGSSRAFGSEGSVRGVAHVGETSANRRRDRDGGRGGGGGGGGSGSSAYDGGSERSSGSKHKDRKHRR